MTKEHVQPQRNEPTTASKVRQSHDSLNGNGDGRDKPDDSSAEHTSEESEKLNNTTRLYLGTAGFTIERIKTLHAAHVRYARGLQHTQQAYVQVIHQSMELLQRVTRELIRCTSPTEVADVHRNLLREGMDQWFEGGNKILLASRQITDDAVLPMEEYIERPSQIAQ